MKEVYKIIGNPKSLWYNYNEKKGELIVNDKIIHVINDRSIQNIWYYFKSEEVTRAKEMSPKEFSKLSVDNQKKVSAELFSRRKVGLQPIRIFINAKYKCLLNTATDKLDIITVNQIIDIFDNVKKVLGVKNDWKISEKVEPTWEFTIL